MARSDAEGRVMGALWLVSLVVVVPVLVWAACRAVDRYRALPPVAPLRLVQGSHVRVWPAWWDQLDQWRDEA